MQTFPQRSAWERRRGIFHSSSFNFVVSCFRVFVFVLEEKHESTKDEISKKRPGLGKPSIVQFAGSIGRIAIRLSILAAKRCRNSIIYRDLRIAPICGIAIAL
jgi:hypothetical protein